MNQNRANDWTLGWSFPSARHRASIRREVAPDCREALASGIKPDFSDESFADDEQWKELTGTSSLGHAERLSFRKLERAWRPGRKLHAMRVEA
jgi:hypothetical protein